MQDGESENKTPDKNDRLLSDFAATKRQSRSLYRNWAVVSRKSFPNGSQSQTNVFTRISTSSIGNEATENTKGSTSSLIEDRVDEIVRHIEQSHALMDDNPKSNNDRIASLREMTEYLTLKRSVKKKLTKSMSSNKTLTFSKRLKYSISIFFYKIPVAVRHFTSSFELWYSSLKVIEGHFGSNVASYFKFLRKLFLLNACIFILMLFFVMVPQLLFRLFQYVDDSQISNSTSGSSYIINETESVVRFLEGAETAPLVLRKENPYEENGEFRLGNIFTGEGFLTNTILFYGYYTNSSLQLIKGHSYNIPAAYFFTSSVCYVIIFIFLFMSVAVSYRKCYIEASGGMHNTFSNKIFCGWDFGISNRHAAELKSRSIYIEIKELLDDLSKPTKKRTCLSTFYTTAISLSLNGLLLFLLVIGGMYSWKYLDQQMTKADTATTMMMWLILTLVVAVAPVLFSFIAHIEGFESPSSALYMTLIRTFTLYAIVIAVVVAFRLKRSSESECWETILGQDMFRLVVLDFIFGSIGTALSEFIRYRIFIKMWHGIGCPEFDIARSTMNLIYNQTLFYIGLFFSPVLSLLITIKLFVIFYLKKWGAIYNCKPFGRPWRASQAHTVYLSIAFFAFFCVIMAHGYIFMSVKTSNCGPFRGETYMYEKILGEILANKSSSILVVLYYITRPGVVGIVLMAMLLGVYYMRAVALARIHVVKHLRYLLRLKAEDRKLLLNEIAKYTKKDPPDGAGAEGFQRLRARDSFRMMPSGKLSQKVMEYENARIKGGVSPEQLKKGKHVFSSMSNLQKERDISQSHRSGIFSSVQNVSFSGNTRDSVELHYKFDKANYQDGNAEENLSEAHASEMEESFGGATSRGGPSNSTSKVPKNEELDTEPSSSSYSQVRQLNFNPVFTESIPLSSDEEADCLDVTGHSDRIERLRRKGEEELLTEEEENLADQSISTKGLFKGDERVPSRISFVTDVKKK